MYPYIYIILPSYMVMASIGGFIVICYLYFQIEKYNIQFMQLLLYLTCCIIGAFIGSKILFAITQLPWLINNFSLKNLILIIPQSGFVFYGGLFGVIFTIIFLTRKDKELRDKIFKMSVPAMPLFHTFGRIGCFLAGCCYGKKLSTPIIIQGIELTNFPVQLLEAFLELIIFIALTVINNKKPNSDILCIYLITYAIVRFFDEFLRGDEIRGILFGLSTAQWISLTILLYYLIKKVQDKKSPIYGKKIKLEEMN